MNVPSLAVLVVTAVISGCSYDVRSEDPRSVVAGTPLDDWVEEELLPYLEQQLTQHPRFAGEPVVLRADADAKPRARVDGLSQALIVRLNDALLATPGVRLVSESAGSWELPAGADPCQLDEPAEYAITLDVRELTGARVRVRVRALDLAEQSWVSGFARQWEGVVGRMEQLALRRSEPVEQLRGSRELPFTAVQADLAAELLARRLGCDLRAQGAEGQPLRVRKLERDSSGMNELSDLVAHRLASMHGVRTVTGGAALELQASSHTIDGKRYLASLSIAPADGAAGTVIATADVYMSRDVPTLRPRPATPVEADRRVVPATVRTAERVPPTERGPLISPLRVLKPVRTELCHSGAPFLSGAVVASAAITRGECFALELDVRRDAQLFVLQHGLDAELVRRPLECGSGGPYRTRAGATLRLPLAGSDTFSWRGRGGLETYYVVAVNEARAAADLERLLRLLPSVCDPGGRTALQPPPRAWLADLERLMARHATRVDWQALRVRHVL